MRVLAHRPTTRRLLVPVAALLAGVLVTGCGSAPSPKSDRLPDVRLSALRPGDSAVDLHTLRGPAVVNLWASWCGPCRKELPIYQQFHTRHPGVRMLGVDFQDPAKAKALRLVHDTGVSYPLTAASGDQISAQGLPKLIMVDKTGHISFQQYVEITSLGQLEKLVRTHLPGAL